MILGGCELVESTTCHNHCCLRIFFTPFIHFSIKDQKLLNFTCSRSLYLSPLQREDANGLPFLQSPAAPPNLERRELAVVVTRRHPQRADNSTRRDGSRREDALTSSIHAHVVLLPSTTIRSSAVSVLLLLQIFYANGIQAQNTPWPREPTPQLVNNNDEFRHSNRSSSL